MKRYLICSGKGGVGKSTLSVCIAKLHLVRPPFDESDRRVFFADSARRVRSAADGRGFFENAFYSSD